MFVADGAFVGEEMKVDDAIPELAAIQDDGNRRHAVHLPQGEDLEEFVEGTEAAGEDDEAFRTQEEVHFADGEVAKLKAEVGRDEGVGQLLFGQGDVEADRFRTDVVGTAVGGFHDAGAAAGDDGEIALAVNLAGTRHEVREFAGVVVEMGFREDALGAGDGSLLDGAGGVSREVGFGLGETALRFGALDDLGAAEDNERAGDAVFGEQDLGLEEF